MIEPCLPTPAKAPTRLAGFRIMARRDGDTILILLQRHTEFQTALHRDLSSVYRQRIRFAMRLTVYIIGGAVVLCGSFFRVVRSNVCPTASHKNRAQLSSGIY